VHLTKTREDGVTAPHASARPAESHCLGPSPPQAGARTCHREAAAALAVLKQELERCRKQADEGLGRFRDSHGLTTNGGTYGVRGTSSSI
jgi:hypothetical protein